MNRVRQECQHGGALHEICKYNEIEQAQERVREEKLQERKLQLEKLALLGFEIKTVIYDEENKYKKLPAPFSLLSRYITWEDNTFIDRDKRFAKKQELSNNRTFFGVNQYSERYLLVLCKP